MFMVPPFSPHPFKSEPKPFKSDRRSSRKPPMLKGILLVATLWILLPAPSRASLQFVEANYGGPILDDVTGLTGSPDGQNLYATGYWNGVIAVYGRDSGTGRLTLTETQRDGTDGVDGLDSIMDATVSPDGRSLYAVGDWDDGLAVFSRNLTTGALIFVALVQDEINGVEGIYGASAISISTDGNYLYVAGTDDDAVALFSRDRITGRLTFVEMHQDGMGGVDGLGGVRAVTVSTDGNHLYTAGEYDSAVAVFSLDSDDDGDGILDAVENGGPNAGDGNGAQISQHIVTLRFIDGRRGDDVLAADGMIVDIGGPAFKSTESTPPYDSGDGGYGEGGDGGSGCLVMTTWPTD